ncbi:hypothetical protein ABE021_11480 [Sporosarcina gallistercoris]|uniref:hypothetical protein n=1 Tax=Sporosarcina gallistercoris TaxID=2762245 RepID=UPI003D2B8BEF
MDYFYSVSKEQETYSWIVGYKEKISMIEENEENANVLENFMTAVNDAYLEWIELILSVSYFLLIVVTLVILYKKKRNMLNGYALLITSFGAIAFYIAVQAFFDLSRIVEELNYLYLLLTS